MSPLDFNLLNVFDTLYEQRSVTRAAARLGLTQSAVSHALRRLREAIGDPLFVRAGRTLQPTQRATAMAPAIREGLARLRGALVTPGFDPATTRRGFTIAAGSYFCALTIPALVARVRALAPGIAIRVVPVDENLLAALDEGIVDLALGAFGQTPARLTTEPLFGEELVWVAAIGHALAGRPVLLAELNEVPRLTVGTPRPFGTPEGLLITGGLELRAVSDTSDRQTHDPDERGMVYDANTAIEIVGASDLIALVPRRIAETSDAMDRVTILDSGTDHPRIDLQMLWHRKMDGDAGLTWLCEQLTHR